MKKYVILVVRSVTATTAVVTGSASAVASALADCPIGIYNHTAKKKLELQFVPERKPDIDTLIKDKEPPETRLQRFERLTGYNPCQCPVCKKGQMVVKRELPRIRSPGRVSTSEFLLSTF